LILSERWQISFKNKVEKPRRHKRLVAGSVLEATSLRLAGLSAALLLAGLGQIGLVTPIQCPYRGNHQNLPQQINPEF
jgi:hypothetical protein